MNDEENTEQATPWTRHIDKILYGNCYETADGRRIDTKRLDQVWSDLYQAAGRHLFFGVEEFTDTDDKS